MQTALVVCLLAGVAARADAVTETESGTAGYRSRSQDSTYNVVYVPFDAGLLKKGTNEVTLGHAEAVPFSAPEKRRRAFGQVMYDAVRLEVDPAASADSE